MTSSLSHPLIESMFLPWRQQHSFQSWPSTRTETDTLNMLYGKPCLLDEQCLKVESVKVSYCDRSEEFLDQFGFPIEGECPPKVWFWIFITASAILFIGIFISCCCILVKCIFRYSIHLAKKSNGCSILNFIFAASLTAVSIYVLKVQEFKINNKKKWNLQLKNLLRN